MKKILWTILFLSSLLRVQAYAQTERHGARAVTERLAPFLLVDRLDYYKRALEVTIAQKAPARLLTALSNLTPEELMIAVKKKKLTDENFTPDLHSSWWVDIFVQALATKKIKLSNEEKSFLVWGHTFFKRKLSEAFVFDQESSFVKKARMPVALSQYILKTRERVSRAVGWKRDAEKPLLDYEVYISSKTTRAIFWEALQSGRELAFFIGELSDFYALSHTNQWEILGEVKTYARNYNKVFLVYDSVSEKSFYAIAGIVGQDRLKHFYRQLDLISWENKNFTAKSKIKVYGDADALNEALQQDIEKSMAQNARPDVVVIGQRQAMLDFFKDAATTGGFAGPANISSDLIRKEDIAALTVNSVHFSYFDILLEDTNGDTKRWRFFENFWGDEMVPLARALRTQQVPEVYYIGTAGAMDEKTLKLGELVTPGRVLGSKPKNETKLKGSENISLGTVYSPFQETPDWLAKWNKKIDLVEIEVLYLAKTFENVIPFQPYLLVSDIIGSNKSNLAYSSASASLRKRSLNKLLNMMVLKHELVRVQKIESKAKTLTCYALFN